jgi:hypothetical protein
MNPFAAIWRFFQKRRRVHCSECGTKPARHFITTVVDHDVTTQQSLCDDCNEIHMASLGLESFKRGAKCEYCGKPATGASAKSPWERAAGDHSLRYSCLKCSTIRIEELEQYCNEGGPANLVGTESEKAIALVRELDARVRRRAQKR